MVRNFEVFCFVPLTPTFKIFTREEGGAEHCQGDNLTIGIAYIADWLSDRLKTR